MLEYFARLGTFNVEHEGFGLRFCVRVVTQVSAFMCSSKSHRGKTARARTCERIVNVINSNMYISVVYIVLMVFAQSLMLAHLEHKHTTAINYVFVHSGVLILRAVSNLV